jgi:hypothetical protein
LFSSSLSSHFPPSLLLNFLLSSFSSVSSSSFF